MLSSKTLEIILISYDVYGAGHYCKEVAVCIQLLMFQGPGEPSSMLGVCYRARAACKHTAKTLLLLITIALMDRFFKILTALESAYLVPKLVRLSRYHMIYVARGSTAKKLRCVFRF